MMRASLNNRAVGGSLAVLLAFVSACGDGSDGSACSVRETDAGAARIECDDGTSVTIESGADGVDGLDGEDGDVGALGDGCSVSDATDGGALVECEDGSSVWLPPGVEGSPGADGQPGASNAAFGVADSGLNVSIEDVTIDDDGHPILGLLLTDASGVGLDAAGVLSSGLLSFRFTFAYVPVEPDGGPGPYVNYIVSGNGQPGDERGTGEFALLDPTLGAYAYRAELALPEDYDPSLTHVVSVLVERQLEGVTYLDHDVMGFVPADANAEPMLREVSNDATCNSCHDRLTVHGNHRSGYQVCLTCHTQQAVDPDTGNSIAFREMLHKIHMGANLPSYLAGDPSDEEWYAIIGYGGSVHTFDQVRFPQDPSNCGACHTGPDADWLDSRPSIEACTSCHDRSWFGDEALTPAGYVPHTAGPKDPDRCVDCHASAQTVTLCPPSPSGSTLCDGFTVHYNPFTEPAATTFTVDMFEVEVTDLATTPIALHFQARSGTNEAGPTTPVALSAMTRVRIMAAGPNADYANSLRVQFEADAGEVELSEDGGGMFTATLHATSGGPALTWSEVAAAIGPAVDAESDSFTFSMRAAIVVNEGLTNEYTAYTINPTVAVTFDESSHGLLTRREVVSDEKCNGCHEDLRYTHHGGAYRSVKQCNMCHMPWAQRPRRRLGPMVHDIHGQQYFEDALGNEVEGHTGYPGDARNCEACHLPGTYGVDSLLGVLPTGLDDEDLDPDPNSYVGPATAFCTGCHAAPRTLAHASINTVGYGEQATGQEVCGTCHGDGKAHGVDTVHARPEHE